MLLLLSSSSLSSLPWAGRKKVAFDIYFGIIVFLSMAGYMVVTVWITEWRTKFRREMIESDNDARQKCASGNTTH